jgi:hypothetical protein
MRPLSDVWQGARVRILCAHLVHVERACSTHTSYSARASEGSMQWVEGMCTVCHVGERTLAVLIVPSKDGFETTAVCIGRVQRP